MNRRTKTLALLLCCACVALLLSGCVNIGGVREPAATLPPLTAAQYTDLEAVFRRYNEVTFADTLETLTQRYGTPETSTDENGVVYLWIDEEGFGFLASFFETGELRAKILNYEDLRQFADLCGARNLGSAEFLKETNTFKECVEGFVGRPIEIVQIAKDATGTEISRVYSWVDANHDIVQILFKPDGTIESISTTVREE